MAIDKSADLEFIENGLTAIADKIREKGGSTDALSFPDGFVLAIDALSGGSGSGGDSGGGGATTATKRYNLTTFMTWKSTGNTCVLSDWMNRTYYTSMVGDGESWQIGGAVEVGVMADIDKTQYVLDIRNMASAKELWYFTGYNYNGYSATYSVFDLTTLDSIQRVGSTDYSGDYAVGTYEFVVSGGVLQLYYYGE